MHDWRQPGGSVEPDRVAAIHDFCFRIESALP
jgi:hypothetical protein